MIKPADDLSFPPESTVNGISLIGCRVHVRVPARELDRDLMVQVSINKRMHFCLTASAKLDTVALQRECGCECSRRLKCVLRELRMHHARARQHRAQLFRVIGVARRELVNRRTASFLQFS